MQKSVNLNSITNSILLLFCSSLIIIGTFKLYSWRNLSTSLVSIEHSIARNLRTVRNFRHAWADESRNIYIDLGSNNGDSINSFFDKLTSEDIRTDGSSKIDGGWKSILSRPDGRSINGSTWHVIAVEANDGFTDRLNQLGRELFSTHRIQGMKIYNGTAIGNKDGKVDFFWDHPNHSDAGSTIMSDSRSATPTAVNIPLMDIVTLFRRERITVEDFVVVKMDVEGAEYDIMRRVLNSGLYRYIDKMAIEWHHNAFYVFGMPNKGPRDYEKRAEIHSKYKAKYEALKWMMEDLHLGPMLFEWG